MIPQDALSKITLHCSEPMQPDLGVMAMIRTIKECGDFARASFATSVPQYVGGHGIEVDFDEALGAGGMNSFSIADLNAICRNVRTEYGLIVQWDAWAVHSDRWDDHFLKYDYIGPVWPWFKDGMNVGCGGFSMYSRRLLDAIEDIGVDIPVGMAGDIWVCRHIRPRLERQYRIKFAPDKVANRFAFERVNPAKPTLGFHGLFNVWQFLSDTELARDFIPHIAGYAFKRIEAFEFLDTCLNGDRPDAAAALKKRFFHYHGGPEGLSTFMVRAGKHFDNFNPKLLKFLEAI
jgi:hypothetical protein